MRRWNCIFAIAISLLVSHAAFALPGDNLAIGANATISMSSGLNNVNDAPNCRDLNPGSSCHTGPSVSNNNQWIHIDLGAEYPVQRIRLMNDPNFGYRTLRFLVTAGDASLQPPAALGAVTTQARYYQYVYGSTNSTLASGGLGPNWTTMSIPTGPRKVRWVRIFQLNNNPGGPPTGADGGILNFAEIDVTAGNPFQRTIVNGGFESPAQSGSIVFIPNGAMPGWSTTDQTNQIEVWTSTASIAPFAGSQMIELNAFTAGAISQTICVFPQESFQWELAHHPRGTTAETMRLVIDGQEIADFTDDATASSPTIHNCTLRPNAPPGATCAKATPASTATAWQLYRGNWANPSSNTAPKAVTFELIAITGAQNNPSLGNLLDAFSLTGLAATVEFSTASSSAPANVPSANLPKLLINGLVTTPQTVQIQVTGGTAGVDYLPTGTITVTIPVPPLNTPYDGTLATALSISPPIQIVNNINGVYPKTLQFSIGTLSSGLTRGGANCTPGRTATAYTIEPPPPSPTSGTLAGNIACTSCLCRTPCPGETVDTNFYSFMAPVTVSGPSTCTLTATSTTTGLVIASIGPTMLQSGVNFVTGTFSAPTTSTPFSIKLTCTSGSNVVTTTMTAPLPACSN